MISIVKTELIETKEGENYFTTEIRGLSDDDKPTEVDGRKIGNGSIYLEIDTGKIFLYDLSTETWKEI